MNAALPPLEEDEMEDFSNQGGFATTHWSVVLAAGRGPDEQARTALEKLCRVYSYPLYAYIRRKGHNHHDAEDLRQAIFERFLEKGVVQRADPKLGRFRSFLLGSLKNFLANEWDRLKTEKRGGKAAVLSLDDQDAEGKYLHEAIADVSPEKNFDRRWALTVLENALHRLGREWSGRGKTIEYAGLKQFLSAETKDGEYQAAGARLGMTGEAVGVAVHRLRRRYRELVRAEIAETVSSEAELEEEMRHLFAALS